jgi:hypothetical protein
MYAWRKMLAMPCVIKAGAMSFIRIKENIRVFRRNIKWQE